MTRRHVFPTMMCRHQSPCQILIYLQRLLSVPDPAAASIAASDSAPAPDVDERVIWPYRDKLSSALYYRAPTPSPIRLHQGVYITTRGAGREGKNNPPRTASIRLLEELTRHVSNAVLTGFTGFCPPECKLRKRIPRGSPQYGRDFGASRYASCGAPR